MHYSAPESGRSSRRVHSISIPSALSTMMTILRTLAQAYERWSRPARCCGRAAEHIGSALDVAPPRSPTGGAGLL